MPNLSGWLPRVFGDRTVKSTMYDYGSMMGYPSGQRPPRSIEGAQIIRKDGVNGGMIYQGGHKDPRLAAVSVQDVVRVAAMYPGNEEQKKEVETMEQFGAWPQVEVKIDGVVTTVAPVPTDTSPIPEGMGRHKALVVNEAVTGEAAGEDEDD